MTNELVWGPIIAWYLFLAGLGAGAFISAAFLRWRHPEAVHMRRAGLLVAPIAVGIGLVLLMVDAEAGLYDPLRFFYLLTNFNSVMTWGVVFLGLFMVVSVVALVLKFRKRSVPRWLYIAGVVIAVCVAAYTGVLLGVCRTYPLWNNALLPVLFLVSALSSGMAFVLLAAVVRHAKEFNKAAVFKKFHFCLPIVEMLLLASLCFITASNSPAGWESVMKLVAGEWSLWFWLGLVGIGLVIPTVLETWLLFFTSKEFEESRKAHWISACSDAGVLVGGLLLRLLVVMAAVPVTFVM